jgi:hypothetical protein
LPDTDGPLAEAHPAVLTAAEKQLIPDGSKPLAIQIVTITARAKGSLVHLSPARARPFLQLPPS